MEMNTKASGRIARKTVRGLKNMKMVTFTKALLKIATWKDGSYYKGQFKKGLKHGKGIFFKKAQNDPDKWILFEGNF